MKQFELAGNRKGEAFRPRGVIVRQISMRWGSMSPAGRLLLNTRLIEAPVYAIDYVITHELCHLKMAHHGPEFYAMLTRLMPDWEKRNRYSKRFSLKLIMIMHSI